MKKKSNRSLIIFLVITISLFAIIYNLSSSTEVYNKGVIIDRTNEKEAIKKIEEEKIYGVYYKDKLLKSFRELNDAIYFATVYEDSFIVEKGKSDWIWHNVPKYHVYCGEELIEKHQTYSSAVKSAKNYKNSYVYSFDESITIWSSAVEIKDSVILKVPFIQQLPQLLRGCEVTSLAMLLQYIGYDVDKMTLAEQIDKDTTPYKVINGVIYYGDPSVGFLGSMTDPNKDGYGANHIPITKLLERYIKGRAIDITGVEFEDLYYFLNENAPVWVITNTDLKKLNRNEFYTWQTPLGETITATNKEHSVLITGYDKDFIYINDPLYNKANRKINKKDFIEGWQQMGSQAVTYIP